MALRRPEARPLVAVACAGEHTFDIAPTGMGLDASVLETRLTIAEGMAYSVAAIGNVANDTLDMLALVDDSGGLDRTLDSRLQITHAADGIGQVDLWNVDTGAPVLEDVDYGETAVIDIPSANLRIGLDADADGAADFVFAIPALAVGTFADVYAVVDADGPSLVAHLPDGDVVKFPVAGSRQYRARAGRQVGAAVSPLCSAGPLGICPHSGGLSRPQPASAVTTGVARGAAFVSDAVLTWGHESDRWDVVGALVAILVQSAELGSAPDERLVNEELAARFGPGLPVITLATP